MSHEMLNLTAGETPFRAALFPSAKAPNGPGLVVVHEWWGLNDAFTAFAGRFADEGFTVIAPDLYGGAIATDAARAGELMQGLAPERAVAILGASAAELRRRTGKKVAVTGFCMGGALTFAAATSLDRLACAVPFYGIPGGDYFDATKVRCPLQAHFAKKDDWAQPERAQAFCGEVNEHGGAAELHVYDAGHAFMREGDPSVYSPEQAKIAWARATAYLRAHLA
ncbi:MAG: dienelactone hydrolase family protein [Deltaproteobacteria bacterium]